MEFSLFHLSEEASPYISIFDDDLIPFIGVLSLWIIVFAISLKSLSNSAWKPLLPICFVTIYKISLVINTPYNWSEVLLHAAHEERAQALSLRVKKTISACFALSG